MGSFGVTLPVAWEVLWQTGLVGWRWWDHVTELPVVVEPLVHHLFDEEGALAQFLEGDENPPLGDAAVQPLVENAVLPAHLKKQKHTRCAAAEVKG